jgi:uncharacterized protein YjbI with pentapeptide repeats
VTEIREQDLSGAHLEHVDLTDAHFSVVDFSGAQFRNVAFNGSRMRGVEFSDVEIDGEIENLVVNGVNVAPLVQAELDRRMPERAKMRAEDPGGFRDAWSILERLWEGTITRARSLPESTLNLRVDDEWSFVETLRHLNFACAAWAGRMVLGQIDPYHPMDLPWEQTLGLDGVSWDRAARPPLDEVLAVWRERQAMVRSIMADLTTEQLASEVTRTERGWPQVSGITVKRCLRTVLNEVWEHRLFAERDLAVLEKAI